MWPVMANAAKAKGDKAERDAVALLGRMAPDLVREGAGRMFGAGRKDDVGDLRVFDDAVVQVKAYNLANLATGLRTSAKGATRQLENAIAQAFDMTYAVGVIPIPRAQTNGAVRWLATAETWPVELPIEPVRFSTVGKLLTWIRDDHGPHGYLAYPREHRIATFGSSLTDTVLVAPIEAWLAAYREAKGLPPLAPAEVAVGLSASMAGSGDDLVDGVAADGAFANDTFTDEDADAA